MGIEEQFGENKGKESQIGVGRGCGEADAAVRSRTASGPAVHATALAPAAAAMRPAHAGHDSRSVRQVGVSGVHAAAEAAAEELEAED